MINMKKQTKEELDNKIKALKEIFGEATTIEPTMSNLIKYFGKDYSDVFKKNTKCYINLDIFFKCDKTRNWKKLFENNPWQPITITYRRLDIIFFTWDNYSKYGEEYFMEGVNTVWSKIIYPKEIKYSDIFAKKIKKLYKKNPNELEIQMGLLEVKDMDGRVNVIKDTYKNDGKM